jgi:hypothetical protein
MEKPINPPSKKLTSSFSKSFLYSGKQGGRTRVLGEGHDIEQEKPAFLLL